MLTNQQTKIRFVKYMFCYCELRKTMVSRISMQQTHLKSTRKLILFARSPRAWLCVIFYVIIVVAGNAIQMLYTCCYKYMMCL